MKLFKSLVASALAISLVGCSTQQIAESGRVQTSYKLKPSADWQAVANDSLQSGSLDNGLQWYVLELPDNGARDRVELRLRVKAGSIQETDSEKGLAHFVEHMAFNGTERFPKQDLINFFEAAGMNFGGDINAYTSFDETVYELAIPANKPELIDRAFQVLADWSFAITFDEEEVAKESLVIVEEWRLRDGTEKATWLQEFEHMYGNTLWGDRLPIGDMSIVRSATAEDLRGYYQRWYRPDNIEIYAVYPQGTVDAPAKILEEFGAWKAEPTVEFEWPEDYVDFNETRFLPVTDSNTTSHMWSLTLPALAYDSATAQGREASFITQILTTVLNGRLQRLGEQAEAVVFDAGVYTDSGLDGESVLGARFSFSEGNADVALQQVITELNRFRTFGISEAEYQMAAKQLTAQYNNIAAYLEGASSGDHIEYLMYFIGSELVYEDIAAALAENEQMKATITSKKINQFAKHWYPQNTLLGYYYHPKTFAVDSSNWQAVNEQAWTAKVEAPAQRQSSGVEVAYSFPGEIVQTIDLLEEEGVYIWVLENGLPVVLRPSQLEPGQLTMKTLVLGGTRELDDSLVPAAEYWREARIRSGFSGLVGQDFFDSLAAQGLSYDAFLDENFAGVELSGPADSLAAMLDLTVGTFTESAFDAGMIDLVKRSNAAGTREFMQTPDYTFMKDYLAAVYGDDPRYALRTEAEINTIDEAALQQVQGNILANHQSAILVLVGDVTAAQVTPLLREIVAGMPMAEPTEPLSYGPVTTSNQTVRVAGQVEDITEVRLVMATQELVAEPEVTAAMRILMDALDKRMRVAIREDAGLTYGVSVFQRMQYWNEHQWLVHVRFSTDPEREQEALDLLQSELQRILIESPFTATEISEAVNRTIESWTQYQTTNSGILADLTDMLYSGLPVTEYDNFAPWFEAVTAEQVNELFSILMSGTKVTAVHHP